MMNIVYEINAEELATKMGFELYDVNFSTGLHLNYEPYADLNLISTDDINEIGDCDKNNLVILIACDSTRSEILFNMDNLVGKVSSNELNILLLIALAMFLRNYDLFEKQMNNDSIFMLGIDTDAINEIVNKTDIYDEDLDNLIKWKEDLYNGI